MEGVCAKTISSWLVAWTIWAVLCFCAPVARATQIVFPGHMKTLTSAQTVQGFRFPAGTEVQVLNSNGEATGVVVLHEDHEVDDVWLKRGTYVTVGSVGGKPPHLSEFSSVPGQRFRGIHLPAETQVDFDVQGRLSEMISVRGDPIRIRGKVFAGNTWIEFHPSGGIRRGELAKGFEASGLHVSPGPIEFQADGRIKQAFIAAGSVDRKVRLAPSNRSYGFDVEYWPNGHLKQAMLADKIVLDGKTCPPGHIAFKQDGSLDECDGSQWMH